MRPLQYIELMGGVRGCRDSGYEKEIRQTIHVREVFNFYQRKIITTPINICPENKLRKHTYSKKKKVVHADRSKDGSA